MQFGEIVLFHGNDEYSCALGEHWLLEEVVNVLYLVGNQTKFLSGSDVS